MNATDNPNAFDFLIDFYQGVEGPTLRIDTVLLDALVRLQAGFMYMANMGSSAQLDKIISCQFLHLASLELHNTERAFSTGSSKEISLLRTTAAGPIFCWAKDSNGWVDCSELVGEMIKRGQPCHQYTGITGRDDAIIEIAFQERPGCMAHVLPCKNSSAQ